MLTGHLRRLRGQSAGCLAAPPARCPTMSAGVRSCSPRWHWHWRWRCRPLRSCWPCLQWCRQAGVRAHHARALPPAWQRARRDDQRAPARWSCTGRAGQRRAGPVSAVPAASTYALRFAMTLLHGILALRQPETIARRAGALIGSLRPCIRVPVQASVDPVIADQCRGLVDEWVLSFHMPAARPQCHGFAGTVDGCPARCEALHG